ncbi:MAG: hypothetical protein N2506_01755 [Dehalococcoidales bacterium]|nr:hypothetical protein [Dehalococcoidales bacterium]
MKVDPPPYPFIMGPIIRRWDSRTVPGSNFYFIHWVLPHEEPRMKIGHPPHAHAEAELLIHLGTDPNNPKDLGAEVEICMGPELEKYVITETTVIFIPPNFIHGPWNPRRTTRPWIFIEINQGLRHTEKFFPQLLSREERARLDWNFWHDENMSEGYSNMPRYLGKIKDR